VLEFAEVSFDQVPLAVDFAVDGSLDFAVARGRNVSDSPHRLDLLDEGAGIVARSPTTWRARFRLAISPTATVLSDA
jgi:hypothetical protein